MAQSPSNYAPVSQYSSVSHLPGQGQGGAKPTGSGRNYIVEFDDALMSIDGWRNPRDKGCKITSLVQNRYSKAGEGKQLGGAQLTFGEHVEHLAGVSHSWTGDINLDANPVVQTYTNSIFFGSTIAGYKEDKRYPNVGKDYSYIFVTKIYTFDPETDEYFITELLDPEDKVFERTLKQDLRWSSKFQLRILDSSIEHDLKNQYSVHWNRGLFSLIATYTTCSEDPTSHPQALYTQYVASNKTDYYGKPIDQYSIYTQNIVGFNWNGNHRYNNNITGSFIVERNPDTWWWRKPQTSSFHYGTGKGYDSASGLTTLTKIGDPSNTAASVTTVRLTPDGTGSLTNFLWRLMASPLSGSGATGNASASADFGLPPAKKDLHILTFNDAEDTVDEFHTEFRYGKNTTQPLRHFGSISLSPGRKVGLPNSYLGAPTFGGKYIASKVVSPAFGEYTVQSASNATNGIIYTWFNNVANSQDFPQFSQKIDSYAVVNSVLYGGNWGSQWEAPEIRTWSISKLEERVNVIMANVNKITQMFEGLGAKGFVIIPENIHPTIKNNLDYFMKKAELIDTGPNQKGVATKNPRIFRNKRKFLYRLKGGHLKMPGSKHF